MIQYPSIAIRLPRVAGNARWILAVGCGLGSLLAAAPAPPSDASQALAPASRLASLSSFVYVEPGESISATGFVIMGAEEKFLLLRGVGLGLRQFGVNDGLPDPVLHVRNAAGREIYRNSGWREERDPDQIRRVTADVGAFPLAADSIDAALLVRLTPGAYTLTVESASGCAGSVLAEIYDASCTGSLANVATIADISAAHPAFYGTFRVTGITPKKLLIRAIGPALGAVGVNRALPDPKLTLYNYAGAGSVTHNDDWGDSDAADTDPAIAAVACGAFPLPSGGKDAAVLIQLAPGVYTVKITGKGSDAGLALLEIYEVP